MLPKVVARCIRLHKAAAIGAFCGSDAGVAAAERREAPCRCAVTSDCLHGQARTAQEARPPKHCWRRSIRHRQSLSGRRTAKPYCPRVLIRGSQLLSLPQAWLLSYRGACSGLCLVVVTFMNALACYSASTNSVDAC